MFGTRIATVLIAVITLGFAIGGTMAYVVTPGPIPKAVSPWPVLMYMISPSMPPTFSPYFMAAHVGPAQFQFVNMDHNLHAYMLQGSGWVFILPAHSTVTTVEMLGHAGVYQWVNLLPYPGTPQGATVGVVAVS